MISFSKCWPFFTVPWKKPQTETVRARERKFHKKINLRTNLLIVSFLSDQFPAILWSLLILKTGLQFISDMCWCIKVVIVCSYWLIFTQVLWIKTKKGYLQAQGPALCPHTSFDPVCLVPPARIVWNIYPPLLEMNCQDDKWRKSEQTET